jgi:hypothetical protein
LVRPLKAALGLALVAATTLSACLGPLFPGQCTDEERAAFESIEHHGSDPLIPQDDALGGCRATFTSDRDPREMIEHYTKALNAADWAVDEAYMGPIRDERGNEIGTVVDIGARKEPMAATITGEFFGDQSGTWVVLVRRVSR